MRWHNIHVKVRWVALAGAVVTAVSAPGLIAGPPWVTGALATLAAIIAGYRAPTHGAPQDPQAPQDPA